MFTKYATNTFVAFDQNAVLVFIDFCLRLDLVWFDLVWVWVLGRIWGRVWV